MAPMASKDGLYQYWRIGLWCPQTPMLSYADKLLERFHLAVCLLFIYWENFSRFPKRSRFLKLLRISISGHYTNTYNPSALCRLCPDIGKHLGDFVYARCSNPRACKSKGYFCRSKALSNLRHGGLCPYSTV